MSISHSRKVAGGIGRRSLPRVHPLVDLYNALSVKYRVPAGADDLANLAPPLAFRYARLGDSFLDLAQDPPADDPPFDGEVVLADRKKVLCRRWNWRQDARSRTVSRRDCQTSAIDTTSSATFQGLRPWIPAIRCGMSGWSKKTVNQTRPQSARYADRMEVATTRPANTSSRMLPITVGSRCP